MIKTLIVLMLLGASSPLYAKVTQLSLELRKTYFLRHAYYPEKRDWRGYLGLNWDVATQEDTVYWHNTVSFYGDNSQVAHVSWQYELGFRLLGLDFFYYHKSEHAQDHNNVDIGHPDRFPLEDSLGIRLNFLK